MVHVRRPAPAASSITKVFVEFARPVELEHMQMAAALAHLIPYASLGPLVLMGSHIKQLHQQLRRIAFVPLVSLHVQQDPRSQETVQVRIILFVLHAQLGSILQQPVLLHAILVRHPAMRDTILLDCAPQPRRHRVLLALHLVLQILI